MNVLTDDEVINSVANFNRATSSACKALNLQSCRHTNALLKYSLSLKHEHCQVLN